MYWCGGDEAGLMEGLYALEVGSLILEGGRCSLFSVSSSLSSSESSSRSWGMSGGTKGSGVSSALEMLMLLCVVVVELEGCGRVEGFSKLILLFVSGVEELVGFICVGGGRELSSSSSTSSTRGSRGSCEGC